MADMTESVPVEYPIDSACCADEDAQLVARFRSGDATAFDRIVEMHQARITRLTHRLLGWPNDTEDVVQDIFVKAWRALPGFRSNSSLETWLTRIAINECRTRFKRSRPWLTFSSTADSTTTPATACSSDKPMLDRETAHGVREAVAQLPAKYRTVIVLRYLEEMAVEQVANLLKLSKNAVEVRLNRARKRLRDQIGDLME